MKKCISLILAFVFVIGVFVTVPITITANAINSGFAGGSGTENDPYLIETKEHLNNVRYHLDSYYKMVSDIIFTEADFTENGFFYNDGLAWEPIGDSQFNFSGHFDGDGFKIKGMVSKSGGVFDCVTNAVIENLTIVDAKYYLNTNTVNTIGSIVNIMNESTLRNCHNESNIEISTDDSICIGGIVGGMFFITDETTNIVVNCTNKGNIFGKTVGGIVGICEKGTITNCYNFGNINSCAKLNFAGCVGGIVGSSRGEVTDCYNVGNIGLKFEDSLENYAYSQYCGGIVGDGYKSCINRCYNTGIVLAEAVDSSIFLGGIAGRSDDGQITLCYNTGCLRAIGDTSNEQFVVYHIKVGGITGEISGGSIINRCYNAGNIEAIANSSNEVVVAFAGGISGNASDSNTELYDCYNVGNINAKHSLDIQKDGNALAGGVSGAVMNSSSVYKCYNIGKVIAESSFGDACYGGISGKGKTGTINMCYYLDNVDFGIGDANGISKSVLIEDFSKKETFEEFDFENIWTLQGIYGYKYPELMNCPMVTCKVGASHVIINTKKIEPTCTATGLTEGAKCSVCGEVTKAQETVPATGHKEVVIPAVAPTFTAVGKTEGKKCSVCGTVTVAQKDVEKLTFTTPEVAIKNTAKGIEVTWNAVENAQSYIVYRRVYNALTKKWSGWSKIKTGYTGTSYVDDTVTLGTQYRYTVRAVNGTVMSEYKSTSTLKYNVTPTVKISNVATGVKVTWSTAANATGYVVYRSQYNTKTKSWTKWASRGTAKANVTSWTDKKVTSGVQYKYTVRACNGSFKSNYNTTGAGTLFLAQPTVKIANASTGVKVSWNKVTGAAGYTVYRSEYKNGAWTKWASRGTAKANKTSWTDTKVASGVQYKYTVRAINGKVASTYVSSNTVLYLAQPKTTVKAVSNGINVAWTQSTGATGYTVYRMEYNTKTKKWSSWKKMGTAKSSKTNWTDKSAKKGVQYKYTVKAVNGNSASTYKASGSVKR